MTGTSFEKGENGGKIAFFDRNDFKRVYDIDVPKAHVVRSLWHPKLNQVVAGCSDGSIRIFYDPVRSHNGAKLCMAKPKKRIRPVRFLILKSFLFVFKPYFYIQSEGMSTVRVITPHALPMFREDKPKSTRRAIEKARKDPVLSRQPELPVGNKGILFNINLFDCNVYK